MGPILGQDGSILENHILVSGTDKSLNDTILVRTQFRGQQTESQLSSLAFGILCISDEPRSGHRRWSW